MAAGLILPSALHAQCITPEGCRNTDQGQVCCGPDDSESWIYEECHVVDDHCQLSGPCGQAMLDLGDVRLTPAGTYAAVGLPEFLRNPEEPVRVCGDVVAVGADVPEDRPTTIILE